MNAELRLLLEALPRDTRPAVENLWNQMPPDVRREAELTMGGFMKLIKQNPASAGDLLKMLQRTTAPMLQQASSVAIVGPVNVGKSTLYNALVSRQKDKAESSPVPGTTKVAQHADVGLFELVDTPGADHGGDSGSKECEAAFQAAEDAEFLLIVFDATGSVTSSDRALYRKLLQFGKPHLVVLNKIDLIPPVHRNVVRESAARILDLSVEAVLPVSAQTAAGVDQLVLEITAAEPKLLLKVAQTLPSLRRKLAWQAIRRTAMMSALVGLTPLPLMDVIPLTLLQGNLVLTLSQIYGNKLSPKSLLELASTFGAGWLARLAFQELTKLAGVPGWVLSASVAASATLTIGFTALSWFETGIMPDKKDMEKQAQGIQDRLKEGLLNLGKSRPSKKRVTEELEKLLPSDPPPEVPGDRPAEGPQS
ncbi:50S ribosome-binding GTPase [bacterium]|nr:50S ribosome-binding GTPase [bacterium]